MKNALMAVLVIVLVGASLAAIPEQKRQAVRALDSMGFHGAQLHPSLLVYCAKGRIGWEWSTEAAHGQVCVGSFYPPSVSVWP